MRKLTEEEKKQTVTCPGCKQNVGPLHLWKSRLPDGKPVTYFVIDAHFIPMIGAPCEMSGQVTIK